MSSTRARATTSSPPTACARLTARSGGCGWARRWGAAAAGSGGPRRGVLWGLWLGETLVGCGGVKHHAPEDEPAYGEIKRVFVLDSARGRGAAKQIISRLEAELMDRGVHLARLETGIHQPEALG